MSIFIQTLFDTDTSTLTYIVHDVKSKDAIIIDPVWNYDPRTSTLSKESINNVLEYVLQEKLKVHWIIETHAHADHVTGAQVIKAKIPNVQIGIGSRICEVQSIFKKLFHLGDDFIPDGSQFDLLISDVNSFSAGTLRIKPISTPGHTPACMSYLIEDCVFTGDALFMPDFGTGRCDFPAGSAKELYFSIHENLYSLPHKTRVFTGHDYQPNGRKLLYESTIEEQKNNNIHLKSITNYADFVSLRMNRDKKLKPPQLLFPSIQINIRGGHLPAKENNQISYLKIPLYEKDENKIYKEQ